MLVAVVAAAGPHPPALLAQVAAVRIDQEGLHRRAAVGDDPPSGKPLGLRGGGVAFDQRLRQALQVPGAIQRQPTLFLVRELVLAEAGVERGQRLVDLGQPAFLLGAQPCALPHEIAVTPPRQPLLLGCEAGALARLVDRLDSGEQLGVLHQLVVEGREPRRPFQVQRLDLLVVQGRGVDPPDRQHPAIGAAGVLQGGDGVLEGRRRSLAGDPGDLGTVHRHGLFEGRGEQVCADPVERRRPAIGAGPFREQGIGGLGHRPMGPGRSAGSSAHGRRPPLPLKRAHGHRRVRFRAGGADHSPDAGGPVSGFRFHLPRRPGQRPLWRPDR